MPRPDAIRVVRTQDFAESAAARLSTREHACWQRHKHPARRAQWAGGRLAAKYQFLAAPAHPACDGSTWAPRIEVLDAASAADIPDSAYREVEVLPRAEVEVAPTPGRSQAPHVLVDGVPRAEFLSLAHTSEWAGAYLSDAGPVGLDIERAEARHAAFYRGNFSAGERQWADGLSTQRGVCPHWTFTLLWCLKESLLKSLNSADMGVWQIPAIEIGINGDPDPLVGLFRDRRCDGRHGRRCVVVELSLSKHGEMRTAAAAVGAVNETVFTVLAPPPADRGRVRAGSRSFA